MPAENKAYPRVLGQTQNPDWLLLSPEGIQAYQAVVQSARTDPNSHVPRYLIDKVKLVQSPRFPHLIGSKEDLEQISIILSETDEQIV